jgi:hypothetical protein
VATSAKPGDVEQLRDQLAEARAALQAVARVTANVAAHSARSRWDDFGQLLRDQYSATPGDVATFLEILAGRRP